MAEVLAIANQKGGVGKTTTTINLSAALAKHQQRVLLIDMDPQGNATTGSGVAKHEVKNTVSSILLGDQAIPDVAIWCEQAEYSLIPSNDEVTGAEIELLGRDDRFSPLRNALSWVNDKYDYILIDCPPSLNMLTVNALVAAHGVVIPLQCEYFALEGLAALMNTLERVRETHNAKADIKGLVRTMFDSRNNLSTQVSEQLIEHFGEKVYQTVIPRNIRLAEAPSHGMSVIGYAPSSSGAYAYLDLAAEIVASNSSLLND